MNTNEGIWIKNQIESLPKEVINKVYHFEIQKSEKPGIIVNTDHVLIQKIVCLPFRNWVIYEIIYFFWLVNLLIIKSVHKDYDIINFHIAYPMLSYFHRIKKYIKKPVVITEHWSAYHFNFGVPKPLPRIQRIFKYKIPVITVSYALKRDIETFSNSEFPSYILPNTVDENVFKPPIESQKKCKLFMISNWSYPKRPLLAFEAFVKSELYRNHELIVGGKGSLWGDMKEWILSNDYLHKIKLVGRLSPIEIANYLRDSKALLHPTEYETFSVVCAEAISIGCLVITHKVGGISEVLENNALFVKSNSINSWVESINQVDSKREILPTKRYSRKNIGQSYLKILNDVIRSY
ncbi:glycosyltransferase family 4 protein [Marivirga arenosa]|uniref:Glycosyltransferase family 4 protein n=1 Tax=Marivirga arenosa TaxID=3059076 RepID=A0AA51ZWL1_9BACT|nr:glycosyltransferase family 4 protein [Marivirga sp. BKB1-2]WNB18073.1 glycosyltransferase family 4 protein [Marivirga sp. BKB1-2]